MKLLRSLRGPFWYTLNILAACWRFNLRDMVERPGQTRLKKFVYRSVITVETLLESAFLMFLIATVGVSAVFFFPTRWAYLEIRDTWT